MPFHLFDFLNQPLQIGNRQVKGRLYLAPMSKIGHTAFRELISSYGGCALLFSEMCGAKAIASGGSQNISSFQWRNEELESLVLQIYGNDPEIMAAAAQQIEHIGFFGLDINFGCSVAALCKKNFGAAVLKNPILAAKIVSAVRKAVSIPVLVKFRIGWEDNPNQVVDFAKRFEDAGADALTFHPRIAPDRRTRPPKWEYIAKVKQSVRIPVIGNGDIFNEDDCIKMIMQTGCDAVSLGRLAIAKPWIFAQWTKRFHSDSNVYKEASFKLLDLCEKYFGLETGMRRFHKFACFFITNFQFGHAFLAQISKASDMNQLREVLHHFFDSSPTISDQINISLLR